MKFIYSLIEKNGILISLNPYATRTLALSFIGAPEKSCVTVSDGERTVSKNITDGECTVELSSFGNTGILKVRVHTTERPLRLWECDSLTFFKCNDGNYRVMPNYEKLSFELAEARISIHKLRAKVAELEAKCSSLNEKVSTLCGGYITE